MRLVFYVVLMKSPSQPVRIIADNYLMFVEELNRIVQQHGPFELIYRG